MKIKIHSFLSLLDKGLGEIAHQWRAKGAMLVIKGMFMKEFIIRGDDTNLLICIQILCDTKLSFRVTEQFVEIKSIVTRTQIIYRIIYFT